MSSGIKTTIGASACDVCLESAYASIDNKLLSSVHCGHRVCRRCLKRQAGEAASTANAGLEAAEGSEGPSPKVARTFVNRQQQSLRCPICQTLSNSWMDRSAEESIFEQEKLIRQRVLAIHTFTRENFETTPTYNDYLEQREETIYGLTFGQDETKKREMQEELQSIEIQNQKQIAQCQQKARQREEENIRDIVAKEGTFYEIVAHDYGPGFRYSKTIESNLMHPLQRQYPHLFITEDADKSVGVTASTPALGSGKQPRPIQSGLVYEKVARKQPSDSIAMLRACGHFKERLLQRVGQELWGGLEFQLSDKTPTVTR